MLLCQANPAKYVQLMERKIEEFKEGANEKTSLGGFLGGI